MDTPHETKPILKDHRRDLLNGEYAGSNKSERSEKSRIRHSVEDALHELRIVAESDKIENDSAFQVAAITALIEELLEFNDDPDEFQRLLFYELQNTLAETSVDTELKSQFELILDEIGLTDLDPEDIDFGS